MRFQIAFVLFVLITTSSNAQNFYTSQRGINKLVNKSFVGLVSGQGTSTDIGNFGSLDPANGSFLFKGSIPIGKKPKGILDLDSGKLRFLSIRIEGDILSGSYISLFNNTVLNASTSIQADYSFWFGKHPIIYRRSESASMELKRFLLDSGKTAKNFVIDAKRRESGRLIIADSIKLLTLVHQRQKNAAIIRRIDSVKNVYLANRPLLYDSVRKYNDSLFTLYSVDNKLMTDSILVRIHHDSIQKRLTLSSELRNYDRRQVSKDYAKNVSELEANAMVEGYDYNWFTIIAGAGNKSYYTFDGTQPLAEQIAKKDLPTFRFGLSYNRYSKDDFEKKTWYFNIGFARGQDNNTSLLATQEVNQVRTFRNISGDTIRQVIKKYNTYTDPIIDSLYWDVFANYYILTGERNSGLHLFPQYYKQDGMKAVFNAGIGYVVSFKTAKKDSPFLNAEGYIRFTDVFGALENAAKFWRRNQIGIRFTLPVNLFNQ